MRSTARAAAEALVSAWGTDVLAPWECFASMVLVRLPAGCVPVNDGEEITDDHAKVVQDTLYEKFSIEVPVKNIAGKLYVRISAHVYNCKEDYDVLASAVRTIANLPGTAN